MSALQAIPEAGAAVVGSNKSSARKKIPSRHMYTNEQYRFIWYHREVLRMSAVKTHEAFHAYFDPEVSVSVDGLNQLVGRLRRVQPKEVISAKNKEPWAMSHMFGKKGEVEPTQASYVTSSASSGKNFNGIEFQKWEPSAAAGGHENLSLTSNSTLPPPAKPARHMYTNEQQRFVWFYRNELGKNSFQTHRMFQEYFHIPNVKRTNLNQLAGRLKNQMAPEVVLAKHTEPWAIGRPEVEIAEKGNSRDVMMKG